MFSISSHFSHMFGELPSTAMELGEVLGLHGLTMPTSKESDFLSLPNTKKSRMITPAASYSSPFLDEQKMLRFSKAAHTLPSVSWRHPYPGFPTNADCDPEPGRCRRTDGKKWRCSKDAMADHKYCERHINRNRHRSRKPVENQPTKTAKETPPNAVSLSSPVSPDRLKKARVNNLQPGTVSYWTDTLNRALLDRDPANRTAEDTINMLKSANLQPTLPLFSQLKQHNDVEKFSSTLDCESISSNTTSSKPWESCNVERNKQISSPQLNQGYLRSVLQDFSRPKNEMVKSKKSKVSDSSPASSDFFLSSEVPTREICKFSPLRLSQGIDSSQDDLHICSLPSNMKQLQEDCIPSPWGLSQGGPLAEILTNSKNTRKDSCKTQDLMASYSTSRNK